MKIKKYKCECAYALYPWGGFPVCIRDRVVQHNYELPLKLCTEKGCTHYSKVFLPDLPEKAR